MTSTAIAFFDFDGTLLRRDSGVLCAVPSIRKGLVGPALGAELVGTYLLSKAGLKTRADAMRVGFRCYAGRTLTELRQIMRDLFDNYLRRAISPAARGRVEHHLKKGDRVAILTASAPFFAEPIAEELGISELVGTSVVFESSGRCTGLVDGAILDGEAKLAAGRTLAEKYGVGMERATFYTDHIADLPLLEAVGTPVAVGPHKPLERVARARGWRILRHDP